MLANEPERMAPMARVTRLAAALATPVFVLALVWVAGTLAQRFAPRALTAVAALGLALWAGSIYLVGRELHRALWRTGKDARQTEAGPWGKLLLTALLTVLWFGLLAQSLALLFPAYFRRP
jgi:hypothetical protein